MTQNAGELWPGREERVLRGSGANPVNLRAFPFLVGAVAGETVVKVKYPFPFLFPVPDGCQRHPLTLVGLVGWD